MEKTGFLSHHFLTNHSYLFLFIRLVYKKKRILLDHAPSGAIIRAAEKKEFRQKNFEEHSCN
ncbi:hypothetical protein, partial [Heyndrickxia coagulans]|nr:hypothetical protein [Heyndrickxia coagulans]